MGFGWLILWFILGVIAVYAWISMRIRIRKSLKATPPQIDDDKIRRIEDTGVFLTDDPSPLDLDKIREEEEDFWEQSWEFPE